MKAVILRRHGDVSALDYTDVPEPIPGPDEVKVKVLYIGLNWAELLSRQGNYSWAPKPPYILGMEGVGEVIEKGSNVTEIEVGERIIVAGQTGCYAQYVIVPRSMIIKPPVHLNDQEAAAFGVNFFTAWVAFYEMARVRQGEVGLVHAAAGGVGTAALQLGRSLGLTMYGTSSPQKHEIIRSFGGTPLTYEKFDEEMGEVQPDVVLEVIGGDVYKRSFAKLAPMGRVVLVGAVSLNFSKFNPIKLLKLYFSLPRVDIRDVLRRSRAFMGLHIGYMISNPDLLRPSWSKMLEVVERDKLRPVVREEAIFPMSKVGEAHQYFESRKSVGKVLLNPWK